MLLQIPSPFIPLLAAASATPIPLWAPPHLRPTAAQEIQITAAELAPQTLRPTARASMLPEEGYTPCNGHRQAFMSGSSLAVQYQPISLMALPTLRHGARPWPLSREAAVISTLLSRTTLLLSTRPSVATGLGRTVSGKAGLARVSPRPAMNTLPATQLPLWMPTG